MSVDNTPVGIRALRQMRENRKPSERLTRKINQTYNYFLEHVDPIIGGCVTYLLSEQPSDIPKAMILFLYIYFRTMKMTHQYLLYALLQNNMNRSSVKWWLHTLTINIIH